MPVFLLQPGDGKRIVPLAELRRKAVDGQTIRYPGDLDFDALLVGVLGQVQRCRDAKKLYTLLIKGGDDSRPWEAANVTAFCALAAKLNRLYANDPLCYGAHVTGCSPEGVSEELYWTDPSKKKPNPWTAEIEAANKKLIDAWAAAFPKQKILLAVAGSYPEGMRRLIDYGQATAPGRFTVKINSLGPQTKLDAPQVQLLLYAAKKGCGIGFEANAAWGSQADFNAAMGTWAAIEKKAVVKSSFNCFYYPDAKFIK